MRERKIMNERKRESHQLRGIEGGRKGERDKEGEKERERKRESERETDSLSTWQRP